MISLSAVTLVPEGKDRENPGPMVGCILTDIDADLLSRLPLALVLVVAVSVDVEGPDVEGAVLSILYTNRRVELKKLSFSFDESILRSN